jgi:DUF2914 family protein
MPRTAGQSPEEQKGIDPILGGKKWGEVRGHKKEVPMRAMMVLLAVLSLGATAVAQAPMEQTKAPSPYQVEKIALGTSVESRELVGEATEFDVSVGRIYCWMRINSQNVPATITHVWYADEQPAAEVPLNINYPSMRTWSSKAIWAGKWRVEVVTETGEVLAATDFTVKAQPGPAGP